MNLTSSHLTDVEAATELRKQQIRTAVHSFYLGILNDDEDEDEEEEDYDVIIIIIIET
jgi:hypothetical protein